MFLTTYAINERQLRFTTTCVKDRIEAVEFFLYENSFPSKSVLSRIRGVTRALYSNTT